MAHSRQQGEGGRSQLTQLATSVAGIYGTFLTWAYLQEKLTTTGYGPTEERWRYPVFLNTVQSILAAIVGAGYLVLTKGGSDKSIPAVIPSREMLMPLLVVSVTSSLASPFGYASLGHIDYVTFLLAKSCKLLPVMFLHVTLFRRRYPRYKYLVVGAVTLGVAVFTLYSTRSSSSNKSDKRTSWTDDGGDSSSLLWGLLLLTVNLLFDGLTNTTQDYIFRAFRPYSGPQMMCANNIISSIVTTSYLVAGPFFVAAVSPELASAFGLDGEAELGAALAFVGRHPSVCKDLLGFALCGAVGQVFIFYTLSTFSSVLLVTITVTRKMFTMILSVVAFGHRLSRMQWLGVALVFGGIGVEAAIARKEKMAAEAAGRLAADKKKS
ncbi:hypothetical protein L249_2154 [Ophiocordyceps polyrhachis-furcata BCC 54312]|uniref:UDP-galactose transporter homolog 1 n=1 Tax=Ophiocordyceps polyrhachis-furcata BCC 54312 TaxID=1330021 RepID=A0A367LQ25_9HYPO|nr:hypothetical protein L249_2154 [Ophiocordyceps polyrhachis-furcata BCC 54312]